MAFLHRVLDKFSNVLLSLAVMLNLLSAGGRSRAGWLCTARFAGAAAVLGVAHGISTGGFTRALCPSAPVTSAPPDPSPASECLQVCWEHAQTEAGTGTGLSTSLFLS